MGGQLGEGALDDHDESLAPVDFLIGVVASRGFADGVSRHDRLRVDNPDRWLCLAALGATDLLAQLLEGSARGTGTCPGRSRTSGCGGCHCGGGGRGRLVEDLEESLRVVVGGLFHPAGTDEG
jgi:hypothetical protein